MQDLAGKMLQDVPNVIGGRVHSDCARNLASCRQAFRGIIHPSCLDHIVEEDMDKAEDKAC